MATWKPPKTNWVRTDTFDVLMDYVRIRDNLFFLRDMATALYPAFSVAGLVDYGITEIPVPAFFNDVERGLETLYTNTVRRADYRTRTLKVGDRVWDYGDLNRIEAMELQLRQDLQAHQRRMLKFTLGGDFVG